MNVSLALQAFAVALALLCVAFVPVTIRRDLGLSQRIVRIDTLPRTRWPFLLTRIGAACLLVSFALLVFACLYILTAHAH
jgi:hypothetical protein